MGRSPSRSRSRSRDRPRKEHKEHKKRKDKDRDRDRGREKERDKDRDRHHGKHRDRDRERERDGEERDGDGGRKRAHVLGGEHSRRLHRRSSRSRTRSRSGTRSPPRSTSRSPKRGGTSPMGRSMEPPPPAAVPPALAPISSAPAALPTAGQAATGVGSAHAQQAAAAASLPTSSVLSPEDAARLAREAEAAELDAEVERRRKRVEEWRRKRQAEQAAAEGGNAAAAAAGTGADAAPAGPSTDATVQEAGQGPESAGAEALDAADAPGTARKAVGWSLDDEEDDPEGEEQPGAPPDGGVDGQGGAGQPPGGGSSSTAVGMDVDASGGREGADSGAAGGEEDEEEDPLEAFMKANHVEVSGGAGIASLAGGQGREAGEKAMSEGDAEEEEDPLDAFMSSTVMAQVGAAPGARKPTPAPASQEDVARTPVEAEPGADTEDGSMMLDATPTPPPRGGGPLAAAVKAEAREASPGISGPGGLRALAPSRPVISIASRSLVPAGRLLGTGLAAAAGRRPGAAPAAARRRPKYASDSDDSDSVDEDEASADDEEDDAAWAQRVNAGKLSKGDKLGVVDHSKVDYPPFRRAFYTEVAELARMSDKEVAALRKELDGIKVRGINVPKPIRAWTQAGLSTKVIDLLRKSGCMQPLPIQAQALPIIMSGRDCIGIAKTGSGKTLAFVLPLLRHAKDQPPLAPGDGPIGLIMAPTRELVQQISKEVKKYAKLLGMECTAVFGGSGISNQISELKRGSEVVVCTPGRMIDLLVTSNGKITNLRRVTYLVMDEADRMFDMGFEPQIMRMVNNVRPDRQTVMFSATFPRSVETLARKVLVDPCEVQVGGRSVVNSDISQSVEIRPESDRFLRLLEILGEWYEQGKIIIFVQSQDKCDHLFRDLLKAGYPCLSLHGGKDQSDRECTIADFKGAVSNILVATSVAARGLDVPQLVLVVNYDCPNHHEDYVHRVGRTGRAGAKGTAITFIGPDEDKFAPDLVKALRESNATVPEDLQALADVFSVKRKAGLALSHGSGYGGSGFKFDSEEADRAKATRKAAAKEYGVEVGGGSDSSDDDIRVAVGTAEGGAAGGATAPTDLAGLPDTVAAAAAAAAAAAQRGPTSALPRPPVPFTLPPGAANNPQLAAMVTAAVSAMSAANPSAQRQQPQPQPPTAPGGPPQPPGVNQALQNVLARIQASAPSGSMQITLPPVASGPAPSFAPTPALPLLPAQSSAGYTPEAMQGIGAATAAPGTAVQPSLPAAAPPLPAPQPALSATVLAAQQVAARLSQMSSAATGAGPPGFPPPSSAPQPALPAPAAPPAPPIPTATTAAGAKDAAMRAAALAAAFASGGGVPLPAPAAPGTAATGMEAVLPGQRHFETELEFNDFPQHARWKIQNRETREFIAETTGAALTTKGVFVPPGAQVPPNERKIYLLIQGPTENSVKRAKQELKRILEETTEKVMRRDAPAGHAGMGRYSIM